MNDMKPTYALNLAVAETFWTPQPWQVRVFYNPNYLNSLWLGTVWNLFQLPTRLWSEIAVIAMRGYWIIALWNLLLVPLSAGFSLLMGVCSNLRAVNLPLEVLLDCREMEVDEALEAKTRGDALLVTVNHG